MPLHNKKEQTIDKHNNIGESQRYFTGQSKKQKIWVHSYAILEEVTATTKE